MSNALELIGKLRALAERGEAGEAVVAKNMLAAAMKKHGVTFEMIEQEEEQEYEFDTKGERQLFTQIVAHVMGRERVNVLYVNERGGKRSHKRWVKCTASESVEIDAKFGFYLSAWERQKDLFYNAFIQKNALFPPDKGTIDPNDKEMTPEERARIFRILEMSRAMERDHFAKQLNAGK